MKKKGIRVPGIGHRYVEHTSYKSVFNLNCHRIVITIETSHILMLVFRSSGVLLIVEVRSVVQDQEP